MKIQRLFLLIILIYHCSFSQGKVQDSIKKIIEKDFANVQTKDLKDLVPYYGETGMGFIDGKNKKIIIPPNYYKLDFFKPNLQGYYTDYMYFEIDSKTKAIAVSYDETSPTMSQPLSMKAENQNGFTVKNGFIDSYSQIYSFPPELFKYKNEYLAKAIIKGKSGVINAKGETLKNLDFDYRQLHIVDIGNDAIWFKYRTDKNEQGFISITGEKSLINGIIPNSRSETSQLYSSKETYSQTKGNYYGYSIEANSELSGILDLTKMKWIIEPQKAFKILEIHYATDAALSTNFDIQDRKKLKFYFLVQKEGRAKKYYIDMKGNEYIPKQ
jgi:hypothetical protein